MAIGRIREVCQNEPRLIEGLETSLSLIEDDVFVSWYVICFFLSFI